jgi:exosome complex RNA-binding protein Rrp4
MQIAGKRWRVDLQGKREAQLLLSAVNLPDEAQRRRTAEDELAMRSLFCEGDLISVSKPRVQSWGFSAMSAVCCVTSGRPGPPRNNVRLMLLLIKLL